MRISKWIYVFAIVFLSACGTVKTVATLPDHEVKGYESSASILYESTNAKGTTAMGQVFSPPSGHGYLTDVGFALSSPPDQGQAKQDILIKLRISAWENSRPARKTEWESEAMHVSGNIGIYNWIRFKVPHLWLIPGQKYIAWLSPAGLNNPKNASTTVISMGPYKVGPQPVRPKVIPGMLTAYPRDSFQPNSWTFDYQDGLRAFWRNPNPDSTVTGMTESVWQVDEPGWNLRFEMQFANRP